MESTSYRYVSSYDSSGVKCAPFFVDTSKDVAEQQKAFAAYQQGVSFLLREGYSSARVPRPTVQNSQQNQPVVINISASTDSFDTLLPGLIFFNFFVLPDLISPSSHSMASGCGSSNVSSNSGGLEGCAVCVIITAILALACTSFVALGVAIDRGTAAHAVRRNIKYLKGEIAQAEQDQTPIGQNIAAVLKAELAIEKVRYPQKSLNATIIGVGYSGGLAALTAAAVMALLVALGTIDTPTMIVKIVAISGGGLVLGGISLQVINAIVFESIKKHKSKQLERSLKELSAKLVSPASILENEEGPCYFEISLGKAGVDSSYKRVHRYQKDADGNITLTTYLKSVPPAEAKGTKVTVPLYHSNEERTDEEITDDDGEM